MSDTLNNGCRDNRDFGVLTLATSTDWHKALGLAYSVRHTSPGVPLAAVASPVVLERLRSSFDVLIEEDTALRGFEHKVSLDRYTPFRRTFFIDADVVVFEDLRLVAEAWRGLEYVARGEYQSGGRSAFGLDRDRIQEILGVERMVCIDGAGHAYFETPRCLAVFDRARAILDDYSYYCPNARVADEDVMAIAMTELGIAPVVNNQFVGFLGAVKRGTLELNIEKKYCTYTDVRGDLKTPAILHFARNQCPFAHHRLMAKLSRLVGASERVGWRKLALRDWFEVQIYWRLARLKTALKALLRSATSSGSA